MLLCPFCCIIAASEEGELGPDAKKLCPGISAEIITELADCNAALSQKRKKRQVLHLNVRRQDLTTCYYVFFLCLYLSTWTVLVGAYDLWYSIHQSRSYYTQYIYLDPSMLPATLCIIFRLLLPIESCTLKLLVFFSFSCMGTCYLDDCHHFYYRFLKHWLHWTLWRGSLSSQATHFTRPTNRALAQWTFYILRFLSGCLSYLSTLFLFPSALFSFLNR